MHGVLKGLLKVSDSAGVPRTPLAQRAALGAVSKSKRGTELPGVWKGSHIPLMGTGGARGEPVLLQSRRQNLWEPGAAGRSPLQRHGGAWH